MKKHGFVALAAALACAGPAFAQMAATGADMVTGTGVTLFGVLDAAAAWGEGSITNNSQMVSGANTSSRLGFRGVEDLGGHLGAGFWLESGLNVDSGTGQASNSNNQASGAGTGSGLTFNRRSTVSLMGDWGELRLGRDYVSTFRNRDQTDPFGTNGVGASQAHAGSIVGVTNIRASNMVAYYLPAQFLSGFFGEAQYYMGENAGNSDGNGWQGRLGYTTKAWGVALAAAGTKYTQTATAGDVESWNIGAHWDPGWARLTAGYFEDKVKSTVAIKGSGYIVGAVIPWSTNQVKVAWSSYGTNDVGDPTTHKLALGYVYNFSKRTAAYATYAHVDNRGPAAVGLNGSTTAAGTASNGFDLGMKHSF
jgi:predicted porin